MKTQVISFDSPKIFNLYNTTYGIDEKLWQKRLIGIEIRGVSENSIDNVLNLPFRVTRNPGNRGSFLLIGLSGEIMKSIELLKNFDNPAAGSVSDALTNYSLYNDINFEIKGREFSCSKAYVMGILNVTPDSFSDSGKYYNKENALSHAMQMIEMGADIIDIGGESTRPGAEPVSEKEELRRVLPVIEGILKYREDVLISIDTTKSVVADQAVKAGAAVINDISGLVFDKKIAEVAFRNNVFLIIMHIKGTPPDMQNKPYYEDVVSEVYDHLWDQAEAAKKTGVNKIIIDPGIGFGKRIEDNFELLSRLSDFKSLGYPLLVGLSRKSFLGKFLNLEMDDRDMASAVADTLALVNGARIIRTHNVAYGITVKNLFNKISGNV